jgi:uncharacterized cupredoxin-like copper-binding protein
MGRVWILVPTALLLSACGGSSNKSGASSTGSGSPLQTISLTEKEFSITPKAISVSKPGTYRFDVKNNGQITHAFEVEGNGVEQKTGHINPGASATLTVNLSKNGSYAVYCPIDGHRANGMQASLTVGAASGTGGTTTNGTTTNKGGYGY